MEFRIALALLALAVASIAYTSRAAANDTCGVDLSKYEVLHQARYFDQEKEPVAHIIFYGHPPVQQEYAVVAFFGSDKMIIAIKNNSDEYTYLDGCKKVSGDDFATENSHYLDRIVHSTSLPYQPRLPLTAT